MTTFSFMGGLSL